MTVSSKDPAPRSASSSHRSGKYGPITLLYIAGLLVQAVIFAILASVEAWRIFTGRALGSSGNIVMVVLGLLPLVFLILYVIRLARKPPAFAGGVAALEIMAISPVITLWNMHFYVVAIVLGIGILAVVAAYIWYYSTAKPRS